MAILILVVIWLVSLAVLYFVSVATNLVLKKVRKTNTEGQKVTAMMLSVVYVSLVEAVLFNLRAQRPFINAVFSMVMFNLAGYFFMVQFFAFRFSWKRFFVALLYLCVTLPLLSVVTVLILGRFVPANSPVMMTAGFLIIFSGLLAVPLLVYRGMLPFTKEKR